MKKIIFIAFIAILGTAQAQVTFKPGIRAGANFSHFTKGDSGFFSDFNTGVDSNSRTFTSSTNFYVGFFGALHLTKYYTLQPEIDYSNQGSSYEFKYYNGSTTSIQSGKIDVSYLSVEILNKFTFTDKFNVHVGPSIDFIVGKNYDVDSEVDFAFMLGAGYNFTKNLGIEARVKKGIIPVLDYSNSNHSNVVFQLGGTYTFDLK